MCYYCYKTEQRIIIDKYCINYQTHNFNHVLREIWAYTFQHL